MLKTLKERLAANALELARHGVPKKPFYLTGQLDGRPFSVHREGDRVILRQAGQPREEIDLVDPARPEKREENTRVEALPRAICPDGSPTSLWQVSTSDEALPGCSPIDAMSLPLNPAALQPDQDRTATPTDLPPHTPLPPGGDL